MAGTQLRGFSDRTSVVRIMISRVFAQLNAGDQSLLKAAMLNAGFVIDDAFIYQNEADEREAENAMNFVLAEAFALLAAKSVTGTVFTGVVPNPNVPPVLPNAVGDTYIDTVLENVWKCTNTVGPVWEQTDFVPAPIAEKIIVPFLIGAWVGAGPATFTHPHGKGAVNFPSIMVYNSAGTEVMVEKFADGTNIILTVPNLGDRFDGKIEALSIA